MGASESRQCDHRGPQRLSQQLSARSCVLDDSVRRVEEVDGKTTTPATAKREEAALERIQSHLRDKFLSEIDVVQRRVAEDPESWGEEQLEEAASQIKELTDVLELVDSLRLIEGAGGTSRAHRTSRGGGEGEETCCPICCEDFLPPRMIFSCINGHNLCSECLDRLEASQCSECREDFGVNPPRRNFLAERLVQKILLARQ